MVGLYVHHNRGVEIKNYINLVLGNEWLDYAWLQNNTAASSNPSLPPSGFAAGQPGHPGGCDTGEQSRTCIRPQCLTNLPPPSSSRLPGPKICQHNWQVIIS